MRKINGLLGAAAIVCVLIAARGFAEDAPGGGAAGGGGRGNFNPEEFRKRMLERVKESLGASDEDWKALGPKIENLQKLSFASRMGGGMFRRRSGQGGGGAAPAPDANAQPKTDLETKREALQTLADNKDADAKQVKEKLQEFRDAREKTKADFKKAQDELRELLTPRQEAQLVLMGLLD